MSSTPLNYERVFTFAPVRRKRWIALAHLSWIAPLASFAIGVRIETFSPTPAPRLFILYWIVLGIGVVAGAAALLGMLKVGARHIVIPATIGLSLCALLSGMYAISAMYGGIP